ncbi:hypothetical protein BH11MYX2_BH11MYX2_39740 [soil metagenome]
MYSRSHPSPAPPLSRASLVLGLYGAMGLVGLLVSAGRGNPDVLGALVQPRWWLAVGIPMGCAAGLCVVGLTQAATKRYEWARLLHDSFKNLLGPLTVREILILALASSIGEEALFRGALMPWLGIWIQAAVFALLHIGPGKRFVPWTAMAFAMGIVFGLLAQVTHNLCAPIAAHFMINFLNLKFIVRRRL